MGRGLSSLLGDSQKKIETNKIPIKDLSRNKFQPRKNFSKESLEELTNSIRVQGVIQPIVVRPDKTNDGKYHVIDWKTCSWGWDSRKKNEKLNTYQLTLYKHFFAQKTDADPKHIETHFALLKRTAKHNRVEFFRVTSGPKKTQNALKLLNMALWNIKKGRYIKNRLSCTAGYGCKFYKTKHCP